MRWLLGTLVIGALLIGASFALPSVRGNGESAASKQVVTAVNDFAVAYNSYDAAKLADYQGRVGSLLTSSYNDEFVQVTDAFFEVLSEKKQVSKDAVVRSVAVESIDEDSAEALVAVDSTITNTDVKEEAGVVRRFRWRVSLVKEGDAWKVSNFESIAAVQATTGPTDGGDEQ